jgi:lauroyl/myristoyl acyltransferase
MSLAELRDLGIYKVLRSLPVSMVSRIGATLGQILGRRAHPVAEARVAAALRHLRSNLASDPYALEAAQTRLWANVGRVYAEFCVLHKIVPEGRVTLDDAGTFDAVLADGRPVIVPFVHLGNWEAIAQQIAARAPGRLAGLAAPPPANRVRAQIATMQRRLVATVLTIDGGVWRRAVHHLAQPGGILFVAIDEQSEGRLSAQSFGLALDARANLHKIVRMASRAGAIILPLYSERLGEAKFITHVLPPLEFPRKLKISVEEHLQRAAQLDALYTPAISRLLDQWFGLLEYR